MKKEKTGKRVPKYDELLIPTLKALKSLGDSGSIEEINAKVYEIESLNKEILNIPLKKGGIQSKFDYRLGWSRSYLKIYGLIENSTRGIWSLVDNNIDLESLDSNEIAKAVKAKSFYSQKEKGPLY